MIETIDTIDMIDWVNRLFGSHRGWHFVCGLLVGFFFGADAAACVGIAFECKDVQHDKRNTKMRFKDWTWKAWDGVDLGFTVAGGLVGSLIRWWVIGRFI